MLVQTAIIKNMNKGDKTDTLLFLGTAGARYMVGKQIAASGGAWLTMGNTRLLMDPGPGSLVQVTKRKLDPSLLDGIVLSHKHIDHSVDINIMIEAMTEGGWKRRGTVMAPCDAVYGEGAVILPYLRNYPERLEIMQAGKSFVIGDITICTPVQHRHAVETYGIIYNSGAYVIGWITDTGYFTGLEEYYQCDLLVINMVLLEKRPGVNHLTPPEVREIIRAVRPKAAIITHFGMGVWRAGPWEVAEQLSQDTGIEVHAAHDGMRFELATLDTGKERTRQ